MINIKEDCYYIISDDEDEDSKWYIHVTGTGEQNSMIKGLMADNLINMRNNVATPRRCTMSFKYAEEHCSIREISRKEYDAEILRRTAQYIKTRNKEIENLKNEVDEASKVMADFILKNSEYE